MHKIIIIFFFILLSVLNLKAELPDTVWVKNYNGAGGVNSAVFLMDGNYIALTVGEFGDKIVIHETQSGQVIKEIKTGCLNIDATKDGQFILASGTGVKLYNWQTGELVKNLFPIDTNLKYCTLAKVDQNSKYIYGMYFKDTTFYNNQTHMTENRRRNFIIIWDFHTNKEINTISTEFSNQIVSGIKQTIFNSFSISTDGNFLTISQTINNINVKSNYNLIIYNTKTWEMSSKPTNGQFINIEFSADNSKIYLNNSYFTFPNLEYLGLFKTTSSQTFLNLTHTTDNQFYLITLSDYENSDDSSRKTFVYVVDSNLQTFHYKYLLDYLKLRGDVSKCLISNSNYILAFGSALELLNLKTTFTTISSGIQKYDEIIYPNPATDYLNINLGSNIDNTEIELYNIFGEKLLTAQVNDSNINLNISQFSPGVYFIKIGDKLSKVLKY